MTNELEKLQPGRKVTSMEGRRRKELGLSEQSVLGHPSRCAGAGVFTH